MHLKGDSCFEFETRIARSQYENYEPGTITEFTAKDEAVLRASLKRMLDSTTITETGEKVEFPPETP